MDYPKHPEKVAPVSCVPGKIIEDPDRDDDKVTVILKESVAMQRKYIQFLAILSSINAYYENSNRPKAFVNTDIFL